MEGKRGRKVAECAGTGGKGGGSSVGCKRTWSHFRIRNIKSDTRFGRCLCTRGIPAPVRNIKVHVRPYVLAYRMHTYLGEQWPDPGAYNGSRALRRGICAGERRAFERMGPIRLIGRPVFTFLRASLPLQPASSIARRLGQRIRGRLPRWNRANWPKSRRHRPPPARPLPAPLFPRQTSFHATDRSLIKRCNFPESLQHRRLDLG